MEKERRDNFIREAKRIEEDSLYSSKGHFYAAQFWSGLHLWIGIPTSVLAGIAGASALAQFDHNNIVAGVLALFVAALVAITTFLNPNEKAAGHLKAGNQYNTLRNDTRIFYELSLDGSTTDAEILQQVKNLNAQRNDLNQNSPQIPRRFFAKARKGIAEGEAEYWADRSV